MDSCIRSVFYTARNAVHVCVCVCMCTCVIMTKSVSCTLVMTHQAAYDCSVYPQAVGPLLQCSDVGSNPT